MPKNKSPVLKKSKKSSKKEKFGRCHYHLCEKKRVKLYQCKYCKKYFCKDHKSPKMPWGAHLTPRDTIERLRMEDSKRKDAHPCLAYFYDWEEKKQKEEKDYDKAFNSLLKSKKNTKITPPQINKRSKKNYRAKNKSPKLPKIKAPKTSTFLKLFILAIASYFVAYHIQNEFTLILEILAWSFFSVVLYKKVLIWANQVSMSDDLAFFGLRILGAIISFGIIIVFFVTGLYVESIYKSIPIFILLIGLFVVGLFIGFKTRRRRNLIGVWRA